MALACPWMSKIGFLMRFLLLPRRMGTAFQELGLDLVSKLYQILRQHTVATCRFLIDQALDTLQDLTLD